MTIKEYILKQTKEYVVWRKDRLINMDAPAVLIKSCDEEMERLEKGDLRCSGEVELLDNEFVSHDVKEGRGGKLYHVFNGNINYFPKAKHGRFIVKGEVK